MITDFHAKYFAYELGRRCSSDTVEKLTAVLADAQVDLNPHQIEAALFAFRSPFSKGAILADEVALGKTIEAGLLLAQKWAERRRRMLVIVPANLRKQWTQELADKSYLPCVILEARSFSAAVRAGNLNPFQQDAIIVCSYQFARGKEPYLRQTAWDMTLIDEAHRLRNEYKSSSKIVRRLRGVRLERNRWSACDGQSVRLQRNAQLVARLWLRHVISPLRARVRMSRSLGDADRVRLLAG